MILRNFFLFTAALLTALALHAQGLLPIGPPTVPFIVSYTYWPQQFVQWPAANLPFSMVLLNVDPRPKQPVLDLTFVDRISNKRVHYTNNDAVFSAVQATGEEVHKTAMAYDAADNDNVGGTTSLRLTLADGEPFQWRFVQGSDMSEQGSGLTAMPGSRIPIFAYRELGALAGEGTALQIGNTASPAEVWQEYAHPPYFIPYHGAETASAHTLVFAPGTETWKVTSAPSSLAAGASWELDDSRGNHRTIRIDNIEGTHLVATVTERLRPATQYVIDATRAGDTWTLNSIRFSPRLEGEKHCLTLDFKTPLSLTPATTQFILVAGKKTTLAAGSLSATTTASDVALTLTFTDPKWLTGASMHEEVQSLPTQVSLDAHP